MINPYYDEPDSSQLSLSNMKSEDGISQKEASSCSSPLQLFNPAEQPPRQHDTDVVEIYQKSEQSARKMR